MGSEHLDLQSTADRMGVHYQTAYKWVRSGRLAAVLVQGQYRIRHEDLERFELERRKPKAPRARTPRGGYESIVDDLFAKLVEGDERQSRKIVSGLVGNGVSLTTVCQSVLVPALRRIGDEWHAGRLSISTEHRAAAIIERSLGEHHPMPRGRRRGVAVVAGLTGERHSLATMMAAVALREDNWTVHHLGVDLPPTELDSFVQEVNADLVVLTVLDGSSRPATLALADQVQASGPVVLVGAPGRTLDELQEQAKDSVRVAAAQDVRR